MMLAGIPVPDRLVLELAHLLHANGADTTAATLENAYDREARLVALTITDRENVLAALHDPPAGLEELRGVLLAEHVGRKRDGLA